MKLLFAIALRGCLRSARRLPARHSLYYLDHAQTNVRGVGVLCRMCRMGVCGARRETVSGLNGERWSDPSDSHIYAECSRVASGDRTGFSDRHWLQCRWPFRMRVCDGMLDTGRIGSMRYTFVLFGCGIDVVLWTRASGNGTAELTCRWCEWSRST